MKQPEFILMGENAYYETLLSGIVTESILKEVTKTLWITDKTRESALAATFFKKLTPSIGYEEKIREILTRYNELHTDKIFDDADMHFIIKLKNFNYRSSLTSYNTDGKIAENLIENLCMKIENESLAKSLAKNLAENISVEFDEKVLLKNNSQRQTEKDRFFLYQIVDFSDVYTSIFDFTRSGRDLELGIDSAIKNLLDSVKIINTVDGVNLIIFKPNFLSGIIN